MQCRSRFQSTFSAYVYVLNQSIVFRFPLLSKSWRVGYFNGLLRGNQWTRKSLKFACNHGLSLYQYLPKYKVRIITPYGSGRELSKRPRYIFQETGVQMMMGERGVGCFQKLEESEYFGFVFFVHCCLFGTFPVVF